ncbi:unnamed protein product [Closterium sp. NIES-64]|nr:unnamed protein product [Closterium sp. NIES-64]
MGSFWAMLIWLIEWWGRVERCGCLGGTRALIKEEAKWMPVIGWSMWFSEYLFIARNYATDQRRILDGYARLRSFPRFFWTALFMEGTRFTPEKLKAPCTPRLPFKTPDNPCPYTPPASLPAQDGYARLRSFPRFFWVALFMEGTRFTPEKLKAAQEYAKEAGLPIPRHVLVPRTKECIKVDRNRAVFGCWGATGKVLKAAQDYAKEAGLPPPPPRARALHQGPGDVRPGDVSGADAGHAGAIYDFTVNYPVGKNPPNVR